MKVELVVIGRTMSRYLQEGVDNYVKRLGHYVPFDRKSLKGYSFSII